MPACEVAEAEGLVARPNMPRDDDDDDDFIHAGGRCRGWRALARVCAAEALGTALLVLLSTPPSAPAPPVPTAPPAPPAPTAPPALPAPLHAGLVVAMLVQCLAWVSGAQLNPCVSLAALGCGRVSARRALAEVAAQLAGAALGAAAAGALGAAPGAAVTAPAPGCPLYAAVLVEAACTTCLVLANCAQWQGARGPGAGDRTWPLRVGAAVAALGAFAGPVTGGSMNPARSFGPALLATRWQHHWVYWLGPLAGAALGGALHRLLRPPPPAPLPPPPSPPHPPRCKP